MQGEVSRPRLLASKLLRRPLCGDSFMTDTTNLHEYDKWDDEFVSPKLCDDKQYTCKYKCFAGTWNVGGIQPSDDLNLEDWLDVKNNSYDIYVLGFQEIVPLNAKNVLGAENTRACMKWNSLIRATLNKPFSDTRAEQVPKAGEKQKVHPFREGGLGDRCTRDFRCVISKNMVGISISVWVRSDIRRFIRHANVSCVGCGIMGCLGNKGSVSVRFCLHETSFCFVCCHLASGGKEGDEIRRNSDAMDILTRTSFPCTLRLPKKILDHDRVIWLGDLNYRISLPESTTWSLVEQKKWDTLLEKDQLRLEVSGGGVFEGWNEEQITFPPTYKYYANSDRYYGYIQRKKGEKRRSPAWCDRILWRGKGIKQKQYDRCESRLSDHRPVRAVFSIEVELLRTLSQFNEKSIFISKYG